MNSLPVEVVKHIVELVPLDALVAVLQSSKLTRTCALSVLEGLEKVDATANELPFEARVAIVLHCTSLKTINGLVVKTVDLTKGFSVSMTFHLLRRNARLQHLILYDSIPTSSYSASLFSLLKQSCPNMRSIYSEADHCDVSLISNFLCFFSATLEEVSFPNSQLNSLLAGDIDGVNCDEVAQGESWSHGPCIYGLCHGNDSRRKVLLWRRKSAVESRGLGTENAAAPVMRTSVSAPPSPGTPLRASPNSLRFSTMPCRQIASYPVSPCGSPLSLRSAETGRRSPLAQSSGPRSLSGLSVSSELPQQNDFLSFQEQLLFISRSTGHQREGTTSA